MTAEKKTEFIRGFKYLLFTISAGVIQILTTEVLLLLIFPDWSYWVRYLIGLIVSVIWNFTFNRKFTFKSANNIPKAMLLVFAYYCVFTPLSTLLANFLEQDCGWVEFLAQFTIMFLNLITEFPFQRFVVFRNTIDTNDVAQRDAEKKAAKEAELKQEKVK